MAAIALRPITEGDLDELRAAADRYWFGLMPNAPVIQDPVRRSAFFDARFRLGAADCVHLWAIAGEAKIGFARVDLGRDHDGPWAAIGDFFIEAPWRRQGYGRAFAAAIVARLREQGVRRIDLNVRRDNPVGAAFWQAVGFELASYRFRMHLAP